jgi:diacylglycerol kinase (ATP)
MKHVPLLLNPAAGAGRALRFAQAAMTRLHDRGISVELKASTEPGGIERLARRLATEGAERVVVCGGDGTMHEAVNALAGTSTILGLLPGGRGNDLAAVLGIPADPAAAADRVVEGRIHSIDVGVVNGRRFGTVVALGLDADVALRTRSGWWRHGGRPGYVACGVSRLFTYRAPHLRLTGDFGVREGRYLLCAVSNSGSYGGGVRIAPHSALDDGQLDLCLVKDLPRLAALPLIPRILRGRHGGAKAVEFLRTTRVRIESEEPVPAVADGELTGHTPAEVTLEGLSLQVIGEVDRLPA